MTAMEQAQYYYDGIRNRNIDEGRDVSGHYSTWFRKVPQEAIDVLEGRNTYDVDALDVVMRTAPQRQFQLPQRAATNCSGICFKRRIF